MRRFSSPVPVAGLARPPVLPFRGPSLPAEKPFVDFQIGWRGIFQVIWRA